MLLNLVSLLVLSLASYTTEKAIFTQEPPNVVHVLRGKTAMLVWKYRVDDRKAEFAVNSPRWDFYASNGTISTIASEDGIHNWEWSLHPSTCPARLCNPTRVSKESQATLVISNVTADDNGVYGCTLVFQSASRSEITSKAVMVVTDPPYFTTRPPLPSYVRINEGKHLSIPCTAGGSPEPNVTWVKRLDNDNVLVVIRQVGSATLNITNITRDQSGTYACQATNDPAQSPRTSLTAVNVLFSPEFSYRPPLRTLVTARTDVVIKCSANGNPSPTISWAHLRGVIMVTLSKGIGSATLIIPNITRVQNGTYECRATNELKTVTALAAVMIMCNCSSKATKKLSNETSDRDQYVVLDTDGTHPQETWFAIMFRENMIEIILLSVAGISSLANILLAIFICRIHRNKCIEGKGQTNLRDAPLPKTTVTNYQDSSVANQIEYLPAVNFASRVEEPKPIDDDYEKVPEMTLKSPRQTTANTTHLKATTSYQSPLPHPHYQEIRSSRKQVYESLERVEAHGGSSHNSAPIGPRKYEALTFANKPQSTEYQRLHIYASVDVKHGK